MGKNSLLGSVAIVRGGNNLKLNEDRFRLDIRKKFLTQSVERHWNKLPRDAVEAPSLKTIKARLEGTLRNGCPCLLEGSWTK